MQTMRTVLLLSATLAMFQLPADAAPPEGKGKPESTPAHKHGKSEASAALVVAGVTVEVARQWASAYRYTGYKPLPPGIRKNLARGKPLPPGIARQVAPVEMLARLPVHPGYEWRVCGSDLVLVAIATAVVADVLFDVFR